MVVALKQNALQYMETMGQACQSHHREFETGAKLLLPHNVQQITTGRPGIVAAGPSLNKTSSTCTQLQNKSVIFRSRYQLSSPSSWYQA